LVNKNISVKIFDDRLRHHSDTWGWGGGSALQLRQAANALGTSYPPRSSTRAPITEERTAVFKRLSDHATASSAPPKTTL
jgi:hypothetical protein